MIRVSHLVCFTFLSEIGAHLEILAYRLESKSELDNGLIRARRVSSRVRALLPEFPIIQTTSYSENSLMIRSSMYLHAHVKKIRKF